MVFVLLLFLTSSSLLYTMLTKSSASTLSSLESTTPSCQTSCRGLMSRLVGHLPDTSSHSSVCLLMKLDKSQTSSSVNLPSSIIFRHKPKTLLSFVVFIFLQLLILHPSCRRVYDDASSFFLTFLATARSSVFKKPYPSHSHPFKLPSVVRRLQCSPHWQPSKYPHPSHRTKSTVAIAVVRKFFIAGILSPHRVSLSSRFNHAQEAEHHRTFPKTPTGLDAL